MHSFFRYPLYDYEPVRYVVNPVRCVQTFLCLGCFALAIYLVVEMSFIHVVFKVVIAVTAAAFATITIIDIISTSHYNPIFWNNWILFAVSGALFFFLCVGLLFATATGLLTILIIAEVINAVTAIMFLIDAIYLLNTMKKRQTGVTPLREEHAPVMMAYTPREIYEPEPSEQEEEEIAEEKKKSLTDATSRSLQEKPSKRSTTSYGGTFPVAKNETPLPSPEPKESKLSRKKSTSSSSSQILETKTTRIYQGADGRRCLADGTPLIPVQNDRGELFYQSPDGVIYTCDGIPIVPAAIICGPPLMKQPLKPVKSEERSSSSLQEMDERPRRISRGTDGIMRLSDGTAVKPIKNKRGEVLYLSPEGVVYNQDGIPLASSPERVSQIQDEHLSRRPSVRGRSTTGASENYSYVVEEQRTMEQSSSRYDKQNVSRERSVPSQKRVEGCPPFSPEPQERIIVPCPGAEPVEFQQTRETIIVPCPGTDPFKKVPPQPRMTKSRVREQSQRDAGATTSRSFTYAEQSQGRTVYPPGQKDESPSFAYRPVSSKVLKEETQSTTNRSVTHSKVLKEELRSSRTGSKVPEESRHRSVASSRAADESTLRSITSSRAPEEDSNRSDTGSRIQPKEETQGEARPPAGSRTVAISTRMVPKGTAGRARSAPGSQDIVPKEPCRRCAKSAEEPPPACPAVAYQYQQQQPSSIYHQYVQKQCHCGKMHYQTATTVHGNVVGSSCPFYATQQVPAQKPIGGTPSPTAESPGQKSRPPTPQPLKTCTPESPCGNKNCNCCSREKSPTPYQKPPPPPPKKDSCICSDFQQRSEQLEDAGPASAGLQTISECECESEPSSTWEQENLHLQETTSEVSSIQQTSSDNVQETCNKCHTCGDERCSVHVKPPVSTDNDEVQTSETRMIRARDLQKLNQNLPGTPDSYDR